MLCSLRLLARLTCVFLLSAAPSAALSAGEWTVFTDENSPMPAAGPQYMTLAPDGTVWMNFPEHGLMLYDGGWELLSNEDTGLPGGDVSEIVFRNGEMVIVYPGSIHAGSGHTWEQIFEPDKYLGFPLSFAAVDSDDNLWYYGTELLFLRGRGKALYCTDGINRIGYYAWGVNDMDFIDGRLQLYMRNDIIVYKDGTWRLVPTEPEPLRMFTDGGGTTWLINDEIFHYDDGEWIEVPSSGPGSILRDFIACVDGAVDPNGVPWFLHFEWYGDYFPVLAYYTGETWNVVQPPETPSDYGTELGGLYIASDEEIWIHGTHAVLRYRHDPVVYRGGETAAPLPWEPDGEGRSHATKSGRGSLIPLQVGNMWVYDHYDDYTYNSKIIHTIVGTEMIGDERYFRFLDGRRMREDAEDALIVTSAMGPDEYFLRYSHAALDSLPEVTVDLSFGTYTGYKDSDGIPLAIMVDTFVPGLGIVKDTTGGDTHDDKYVLDAARLNGVDYGAVDDIPLAVEIKEGHPAPFDLSQPYPNPFNTAVTIPFTLHEPGNIRVRIYDINGQVVAEPFAGRFPAGTRRCVWDGTDSDGNPVGSGMYFVRLQSNGRSVSRRMVFLK